MKKKIGGIFACVSLAVNAQVVEGFVKYENTEIPLKNVKVTLLEEGKFTYTDSRGFFSILGKGKLQNVSFSSSKMKDETYLLKTDEIHYIRLYPYSLNLKEINLTAKKKKFSEIELKEEALHHLQSFSVSDVFQQLPGQYVRPIQINSYQNIVFRTASSEGINSPVTNEEAFGNKSFGVSVLVNDVVQSNNANMQSYLPGVQSPFEQNYNSFDVETNRYAIGDPRRTIRTNNPNFGFDLRKLPLGNITKIKVVEGIPSAKYGDLTTGLVLIESKAGEKPFDVTISSRGTVMQVDVSKGFTYGKNGQAINFGFNYLNLNIDPRDYYVNYKRIEGNLLWGARNQKNTLINELGISYSQNIDKAQTDPDNVNQTKVKNHQYAIRLNDKLEWQPRTLVDLVNFSLGFSFENQDLYKESLENNGAQPFSDALESGVYFGKYTPVSFLLVNQVKGKPINLYSNVEVKKTFVQNEMIHHHVSLGASYQLDDNLGEGRSGNQNQYFIGTGGIVDGFRNYQFKNEVKAQQNFSAYLENEMDSNFKSYLFNLVAGLRYDYQNDVSTFSPRVNLSFGQKTFSLRAGYGLMTKAPSLDMIYVGKRYLDLLLADYRIPGKYARSVVQTLVSEPMNFHLKPSKSQKIEVGLDWNNSIFNFGLTAYKNYLYDGFASESFIENKQIDAVNIDLDYNRLPNFQIVGKKNYQYLSSKTTNGLRSEDIGVEGMFRFKEIKQLNLKISLSASYVQTKNKYDFEVYQKSTSLANGKLYGIYEPKTDLSKNLIISGDFSFHLPRLGMVIQVISNHFLINKTEQDTSSLYPLAYLNQDYQRIEILDKDRKNTSLYSEIIRNEDDRYQEKLNKILYNFHLRMTKEFQNGIKISLYGQNFLGLSPTYYHPIYKKKMSYRNYTPFSFGAEINFKF